MLFTYVIQNGTIEWRGGDELLNKVVILVFFVHKIVLVASLKIMVEPLMSHWLF